MKPDPLTSLLHHHAGQHGPVMLMYHAITPGKDVPAWPWAVSMQQFCAQLDFLVTEGYAIPTMDELAAAPDKWAGRTAVITFDDGYVDNFAACEALQKRGIRASWFIVSGSVGQSPQWLADGRPPGRLLNEIELRVMRESGMEIGSHTVNHVRLTEADDAQLRRELHDSRATLEDMLGQAVSSFAYPYGAWDARCADAVREAGYSAACTTRTGWALRDHNPYTLRRLTVYNTDTVSTLARKLAYAANDIAWRSLVRQYFSGRLARRS
ncbi:MAG: polysaccharide deacetylase family protein [Thiobacillus sp.]|nr:polysaccharide deacetylase family protein [Thiobacillus sp.]